MTYRCTVNGCNKTREVLIPSLGHRWLTNTSLTESSVCSRCGEPCEHPSDKIANGACVVCGATCTHNYDSVGCCAICGMECTHENTTQPDTIPNPNCDGTHTYYLYCTNCLAYQLGQYDEQCEFNDEHKCIHCGWECTHPSTDSNHVCTICGHTHSYNSEPTYTVSDESSHIEHYTCECGHSESYMKPHEVVNGSCVCGYQES